MLSQTSPNKDKNHQGKHTLPDSLPSSQPPALHQRTNLNHQTLLNGMQPHLQNAYIGLLLTQRLDMFQQTRKSPNKNKHIQPSTTHLLPIINIPTSLGNILANPYHQKLQQQQQQNSSYTTSRKPRNVNSAPFHPETTSADSTTAPMSDLSGT